MPTDIPRETWNTRGAFVLAAIGSAVGLGNLWGFPYKLYTYGGGAFLIPYFTAMAIMGIPLLIMEFAVGHWAQQSAPGAFADISGRYRFVGWWLVVMAFVIIVPGVSVLLGVLIGLCRSPFAASAPAAPAAAAPYVARELGPIAYATMGIAFVAIFGGLAWCFWRALRAAGAGDLEIDGNPEQDLGACAR